MKLWLLFALLFAGSAARLAQAAAGTPEPKPCSPAWNRMVEQTLMTGDGQGHDPDIGSGEWKYVVEFKLGVRDEPGVPARDSKAWCTYVDKLLRERMARNKGPAFSCAKVAADSIEATICGDTRLSALDRKLAGVYAAAAKQSTNEHPPMLKAGQRGWIKGRDDCWKSHDKRACIKDCYTRRIAELQASYRLVAMTGPVFYFCDGVASNEVVATFFKTDPPTVIAERGDGTSLMFLQPSGSGAKYQGRNETFWEHHGEAAVVWGHDAPTMKCKVRK